jgi:hypothetical protein
MQSVFAVPIALVFADNPNNTPDISARVRLFTQLIHFIRQPLFHLSFGAARRENATA